MYRYLLFRDGEQIYSSNNYHSVLSWRGSDKRERPNANYEIIDQRKKRGFHQALH